MSYKIPMGPFHPALEEPYKLDMTCEGETVREAKLHIGFNFCGRCVEGCKDHALSQEAAPPPIYTTSGELKNSYTVSRKATVKPSNAAILPSASAPSDPGGPQ